MAYLIKNVMNGLYVADDGTYTEKWESPLIFETEKAAIKYIEEWSDYPEEEEVVCE